MIFVHRFLISLVISSTFTTAQPACDDFETKDSLNYTNWSLDHIQTWCKDHDPSSTGQCAEFTWPTDVHYPKHQKLHRNFKEWILRMQPTIGTRADCIARSNALRINTHPNDAGLVEAVTCELYDFGSGRGHECVCFPVYDDYSTEGYVLHHDVRTIHTTTSVFYPPAVLVSNALLAAATQGPPAPCTTKNCPKSAKVVSCQSHTLGEFPYCPAPGPTGKANIAPRTAVETITTKKHHKTTTFTSTYRNLPTTQPDCNFQSYRHGKASACKVDLCIWDFINNFTTTTSNWVTFSDAWGNAVRMDWNTTFYMITTNHWGVYPPLTNPKSVSKLIVTDPWGPSLAKSYSEYRTSLGLSAPSNKKAMKKQKKLDKAMKPVCQNETDCWRWCEKGKHVQDVQMMQLIGFASTITTLAVLGILWNLWRRGRTGGNGRGLWSLCCPWRKRRGMEGVPERTMEVVEIETELGPVVEVFEIPQQIEMASTTGSLGRTAEEGRGRPRIRFFPGNEPVGPVPSNDGAADGVRKVSGRQAKYEMTERGSIRARVPSNQEE